MSGKCHTTRIADRISQAVRKVLRRSNRGAAKAVQPASSPMPTKIRKARKVPGISTQARQLGRCWQRCTEGRIRQYGRNDDDYGGYKRQGIPAQPGAQGNELATPFL